MIRACIFHIFKVRNVVQTTIFVNFLSPVPAKFTFSAITFYSEKIEICLYFLYRREVIASFKYREKICRSRYSLPKKRQTLCLNIMLFISGHVYMITRWEVCTRYEQ